MIDEKVQISSRGGQYRIEKGATKRGGHRLVDSQGYTFTVKHEARFSRTWRCSVRGRTVCKATVKERNGQFTAGQDHEHIHLPGQSEEVRDDTSNKRSTATETDDGTLTADQREVQVIIIKEFVPILIAVNQ